MSEQDFSDKELNESYWFVTHWEKIVRLFRYVLMGFAALVIVYALGWFVAIYGFQYPGNRQFHESLVGALTVGNETRINPELRIDGFGVLDSTAFSKDFFASISNPGKEWRVQFDVVFSQDGKERARVSHFLYPEESDTVSTPGVKNATSGVLSVAFDRVRWDRMSGTDARTVTDKHRLKIKDIRFFPAGDSGLSSSLSVSKVAFTVKNETIHRFWEAGVTVTLFSAGRVTAVSRVPLLNIEADEERTVEARWYAALPYPDSYRIVPRVDVFDERSFRPAESSLQQLN